MRVFQLITLICIACLTVGCTTAGKSVLTPIFRPVDISYDGKANTYSDGQSPLNSVDLRVVIDKDSKTLDEAFRAFRNRCATGDTCRLERNSIQDRLIAASNSICVVYKSDLKQAQSNTNLNFGGASTILGGLGAIAQSATPARLYSGAAAMASGLRAEVNQNIYAMLAVEVITKAIDKSRTEARREIDMNQARVVTNYTLERAISDVVEYHGRCTILAGLQEAATAVSQSENVGIKTLGQTLSDLGQTTTIQLGKKQYNIGGSDTILMKPVCASAKQQYEAFIKDRQIVETQADFADQKSSWENTFGNANYCKNLDVAGDVAAEFDKRWQNLVVEFTAQTDEKERERIIGQIAGQQAGAKAVAGTLMTALETTKSNMQAATGRLLAVETSIAKTRGVAPVASLAPAATGSEIASAVKDLDALRISMTDSLEKIRLTKSKLNPTDEVKVSAFIAAAANLRSDSPVALVNSAVDKQSDAFAALATWRRR